MQMYLGTLGHELERRVLDNENATRMADVVLYVLFFGSIHDVQPYSLNV